MKSERTMFRTSIGDVPSKSCGWRTHWWTPGSWGSLEAADRHRGAKWVVAEAKTRTWEEYGRTVERYFGLGSKKGKQGRT